MNFSQRKPHAPRTALILPLIFAAPLDFAQTKTPAPAQTAVASAVAIEKQADVQYARKNYAAALNLYLQSANMGNSAGENVLGLMYENGLGTAQDFTKAAPKSCQALHAW